MEAKPEIRKGEKLNHQVMVHRYVPCEGCQKTSKKDLILSLSTATDTGVSKLCLDCFSKSIDPEKIYRVTCAIEYYRYYDGEVLPDWCFDEKLYWIEVLIQNK